jgi:class 3 adenylate cyclase
MNEEKVANEVLEQKKSKGVFCVRIMTIVTLITAAIIVASLTFIYSRSSEESEFELQYRGAVDQLMGAFQKGVDDKLNTAKTFSYMYTSRYGSMDVWPNATMPNFQEQAEGQLTIANGIALSFNPIIRNEEMRRGWEAHATETAFILESDKLLTRDEDCTGCRIVEDGIFRKVDGVIVDDPGLSPGSVFATYLVPVWQIYPISTNYKAVMFNLHSETNRQRALDDMLQYRVPTITSLLHLVQHEVMNPSSILFYPVFDTFEKSSVGSLLREVVGSISIVLSWDDILHSVLPSYITGLIVVLESNLSNEMELQRFTYTITGPDVTLIGEGDMHDPAFDSYRREAEANIAGGTFDELDGVDHLITYKVTMYPSKEFQNVHLTNRPMIYTVVVVCIFVLNALIFWLYDFLVEFRQTTIIKAAAKSGRIVNSMFPALVRERLFHSAETEHLHISDNGDEDERVNKRSSFTLTANKIKTFMRRRQSTHEEENHDRQFDMHHILNSPPIAEEFPNVTIMFSDIVGFTSWSSKHAPEDVFHMLETLFFEFDQLTDKYGAYKMGTVGDCYIAVTGVPDQKRDHAKVLAEFAIDCHAKMNEVISSLELVFGSDVKALSMRFGLHSGPVTAGVLRGHRSRFELFGDTINTASRMESTGIPNRIQISQQTADLLKKDGHTSWYEPRDGLIKAKGKGELQTYWLLTKDEVERKSPENKTSTDNVVIENSSRLFYQETADLESDNEEPLTSRDEKKSNGLDVDIDSIQQDVEMGKTIAKDYAASSIVSNQWEKTLIN